MYSWMLIVFSFLVLVVCVSNNKTKETFLEFIHIPKNAGTTIENIADEKGVKWGRFKPEHMEKVNTQKCKYWHVPPKYFQVNNYYDSDDTFCVLRDPRKRMVSEYAYRHKDIAGKNNKKSMNQWLKENLNDDNVYEGGNNCHFLPQYEYIYDDNGQRTCNTVLDFNNLNQDFNELMQTNNIDLRLEDGVKHNKSNFNLTVDDIDDENMKKIFKYYKKDFEIIEHLRN